jgi:hypothetical protein
MRRVGLLCWLPIVGALVACAEPSARPPGAEARCDGSSRCGIPTPLSGGGVDAGAGGTGTAASVQVIIREIYYDTIVRDQEFQGQVVISTLDSQGTPLSQPYDTTAAQKQNLELLSAPTVWVTVTPVSTVSGTLDLVTHQNLDTTKFPPDVPHDVTLYVANSNLIPDILWGLVPSQTTDANAGQVLISFVDAAAVGVANVAVTPSPPTPVLYTEGGVWGAGATSATDTSGQALLANVPVLDGGVASLEFTVNGATASDAGEFAPVTFPVEAGAVTRLTVVIQ